MYQNNTHRLIAQGIVYNFYCRGIKTDYNLILSDSKEGNSYLEFKLWNNFVVEISAAGVISWSKDDQWSKDLNLLFKEIELEYHG